MNKSVYSWSSCWTDGSASIVGFSLIEQTLRQARFMFIKKQFYYNPNVFKTRDKIIDLWDITDYLRAAITKINYIRFLWLFSENVLCMTNLSWVWTTTSRWTSQWTSPNASAYARAKNENQIPSGRRNCLHCGYWCWFYWI